MIPFNKPYLTRKETTYIEQTVRSGKISGNGMFTEKCHSFFNEKLNWAEHNVLTTSGSVNVVGSSSGYKISNSFITMNGWL